MSQIRPAVVVVGADGSLPARRAVFHAAAAAAQRGGQLRVVTASCLARQPRFGLTRAWSFADGDAILSEAAELAAEVLPRAQIATVTGIGSPAGVLLAEARDAEMLVIGNRGVGGLAGLFLGSVGIDLAGRTPCPLLIVRHPRPVPRADDAPVLVGVDGSHRSASALRAAFREADLAHVPLVALQACHAPVLANVGQISAPPHLRTPHPGDDQTRLDALLEPFRAEYPYVRASSLIIPGRASRALIEASRDARLLVVAARGRSELSGLVFGSTSQAAIHHADCPVLLAPGECRAEETRQQPAAPTATSTSGRADMP